jgi:hypothetical protein
MFPGGSINIGRWAQPQLPAAFRDADLGAAAVNILTQEVARLPLKVYRQPNGETAARRSATIRCSPAAVPVPRASATTLKQKMMQPALIHGNSLPVEEAPVTRRHTQRFSRSTGGSDAEDG